MSISPGSLPMLRGSFSKNINISPINIIKRPIKTKLLPMLSITNLLKVLW
jgi:hypothetical protein